MNHNGNRNRKPLFTASQIEARIKELGQQITRDYEGKNLIVVGVLKGSIIFLSDLIRAIDLPLEIDFIGVSSYQGTESTGIVRLTHDLTATIAGKDVLLVEDIIDTGRTIDFLIDSFGIRGPKSLKIASLLTKPDAHVMHHKIEYEGFKISNEFVVGYGLDLDGHFRNLPNIEQIVD